ncbi:MAG: DUF3048 domain-containing protein [Actinomycetota bacterium]
MVAAGLAGMLLFASCSGESPTPEAQPEPEATSSPEPPPVCPLTGKKPKGVNLARPAVAVKVENSPLARPQSGLEKADVVYEEIVEGGITRFMAIYHCGDTDKTGPVRSARFDDPKIALPFTKILGYSGANSIVERELKQRGLISLTELNASSAIYRVPPGSLDVHSLYANVTKLRKLGIERGKPKTPSGAFFEFDDLPAKARKAKSVRVNFNANITIEWRWQDGAWKRYESGTPFNTAAGGQVSTPNVLIQEVDVNNSATIVDVAGNASPDISLDGTGRAFLFRGGKVIKGTWKTKNRGEKTIFRTKSGEPFVFETGSTWIELVPSKNGEVKGGIAISRK